ncbi:reverse transcriptase domain-containing protein [Tanacetum coccineum]
MEKTMKRYGVNHRFSTSYHPQTSGQVENTNITLKRILEKIVKDNPAIWPRKLDDALWDFRTAYKTPTGSDNSQLMEKIEALTTKIDSQFKDIKGEMKKMRDGCNSCEGPHTSSDCDDKPIGGPKNEEANYACGVNSNAKTTVIHDDSEDEADEDEKEINVPLNDVLAGMPNYGKFWKDLVSNKSKMEQIYDAFLNEESSAIVKNKLPPKLGDPGSFLIPCTVAGSVEYLTMADLGASINLMPYSLYASLSGNTLKPTRMSIRLANHTYQYPMGITENMLVQVRKFVFHADFVILQMKEDDKVPLILGRPFLHTADAII